ncbi:unnamed protein product, partial [Mesorhabditis spiculigera]
MSDAKKVSFAERLEASGLSGNEDEHRRFLKRIAEGDGPPANKETGDEPAVKVPKLDDQDEEVDKKKHTLDSDEEEDEDHKRMDLRKVDGQEDGTMDFEGDIKITPFNMKEDEEEGHFDESGNFICDKKEEANDPTFLKNNDDDLDDVLAPTLDDGRLKEIFKRLMELLKPNQTITKALSEIRKTKKLTPAEERKLRWAAKKAGKAMEENPDQGIMSELSALADELISAGHMDAYEWNREKVEFNFKKLETVAVDDLDMFADEPAPSSSATNGQAAALDDEILWEYQDSADGKIEGPFSSQVMADRQAEGKLEAKGLARKVGASDFNPIARIDFDLYC